MYTSARHKFACRLGQAEREAGPSEMNLWGAGVLAAVAGALLGPSLHSWQLPTALQQPQASGVDLLHVDVPATSSASGAAALLERKVLIYAEALPDGVAFDPMPTGVIAVSAVSASISSATGLAIGDVVLSLAGVDVAGDHDPLAALDDAEMAMQRQLQQHGAAVLLVVAPPDAPAMDRSVSDSCPSVQKREKQQEASSAEPAVGSSTGGWRWSRNPCDPDCKLHHSRKCDAYRGLLWF